MKSLKYIWRNVTRNKLRSSLTILSVGFSLALLTVLLGYMATQNLWGSEAKKYNRIVVMNTQGFAGDVPIAYVDRVRRIDGVLAAVPYMWFGGNYKAEQMPFSQFGTDAQQAFDVWSEFTIDPAQLEAWRNNRQGCVVDRRLAARRGWKIGEKIPLQGTYYQFNLDLELSGTFDSPQNTDTLWFHWKYLDEGLRKAEAIGEGNAGTIFAKVERTSRIPEVVEKIDAQFASSNNPTRTQTESAFAQMFVEMLGNIRTYMLAIGLAVVFSLSLVAANAMAMSMRERTTEIAVLKAIGFSRGRVLWMVLGESCLIGLAGGILGVGIGCLFLQVLNRLMPLQFPFQVHEIAGLWLAALLAIAAAIGLASGIVPAVRAAQQSVVNGLRQVV
ncbi:MAG TPA: ABC transporter permease [Pirellulaceae bacterium]|nr:ABC transporter permease [Pirellulaceae bacterium]